MGINDVVVEIQLQLRVSAPKSAKNERFTSVMGQDRKQKHDKEKERIDAMRQDLADRESKLEKSEQTIHKRGVDQHFLLEERQQAPLMPVAETEESRDAGDAPPGGRTTANPWCRATGKKGLKKSNASASSFRVLGAHGGDQRIQARPHRGHRGHRGNRGASGPGPRAIPMPTCEATRCAQRRTARARIGWIPEMAEPQAGAGRRGNIGPPPAPSSQGAYPRSP